MISHSLTHFLNILYIISWVMCLEFCSSSSRKASSTSPNRSRRSPLTAAAIYINNQIKKRTSEVWVSMVNSWVPDDECCCCFSKLTNALPPLWKLVLGSISRNTKTDLNCESISIARQSARQLIQIIMVILITTHLKINLSAWWNPALLIPSMRGQFHSPA